MEAKFFQENRLRYFNRIQDNSLTLLYSGRVLQRTHDQEFPFETDKNFYYLTGINQANVIFALVKNGSERREVLFIEENDPILSKWVGRKLTINEAQRISGIEEIRYIDDFDNFLFSLFNSTRLNTYRVTNLYLNLERRNLLGYTNWALEFIAGFRRNYPEIQVLNMREIVIGLRMIKQEEEIGRIKKAISVTQKGIEDILKVVRPGMYEYQIDAYFDFAIKYRDNCSLAFDTIVASGKNGTVLHYITKSDIIKEDELVLLDLGARSGFYVSDISRTIPANGRFTLRQREVYSEVLTVNKKCIEYLKPGLTWAEFNRYSRELLLSGLKRLGLIEKDEDLEKYYYHSIGHFIGLDTHDPGLAEAEFKPGMVLTVEPGIYIEEEKIGVRIEDNVLITKDGTENLSKNIIKEIDDIERFMIAAK
ncbi:MAG: Xaa-Pro aminopeptidase [Bacilli bacterium]|nr:Xaa-Pro aminopeptidase [Bacilli bacterium]